GIPTFIDAKHAIATNKIMVIDGKTILTGSFNFTKAAGQNNAENLLVLPLINIHNPPSFAGFVGRVRFFSSSSACVTSATRARKRTMQQLSFMV
ncbi:MAG TPA: hypothetical protein DCQ92_17360, partial [Verrucomicrobia subdivision 3 bacterium]|nr:hypothetical protein [Limisphaerales bacterium]